jgi:hypothetical protein
VYFGRLNYTDSLMNMKKALERLQDDPVAKVGEGSVQQWPADFVQFVESVGNYPPGE